MHDTLTLLKKLIEKPSITPNDHGCQNILKNYLQPYGFICEDLSKNNTTNMWARIGKHAPLIVFAGHTDVVPTGDLNAWTSDPFKPEIRNGYLYGRGATDMKSGLAAMIIAATTFLKKTPKFNGSIAFLITSDEEGPAMDGTRIVIESLQARKEHIDYCIVGEATSIEHVGDRIRVGRRGSLHGNLIIHGKQGHIAYPEKCINPIHQAGKIIDRLANTTWDQGNTFFPPTTFQISNIHAGTGATNVAPGALEMCFNFRFSTANTIDELKNSVEEILIKEKLNYTLKWDCSALPFLTSKGKLIDTAQKVIKNIMGFSPELSTGGGTSDGRFIAPTGAEVIELGPCATSAHAIDEHIRIAELQPLTDIYHAILAEILLQT